jgi:hypothetical protein
MLKITHFYYKFTGVNKVRFVVANAGNYALIGAGVPGLCDG